MAKKKAKKKTETRELMAMLEALLRQRRDCSIGMYILLLELSECDELSGLAVDRRMKRTGMQNPRQLLSLGLSHGWVMERTDDEGSRWWSLTAAGQAAVAGLKRRIELAREAEPRVNMARRVSGQMEMEF